MKIDTKKIIEFAAEEAARGVKLGHGGPFGAVIVTRDADVLVAEHNKVLLTNDPTMHAEVAAIRAACQKLGRFSLHDCEIFSTCMPCPMCLGAIMWAKIPKLYYGVSAKDAAEIGFDDDYIYEFIRNGFSAPQNLESKLTLENIENENCRKLFTDWVNKSDKNIY